MRFLPRAVRSSLVMLPLILGCTNHMPLEEKTDHIDQQLDLSREDYRDMYNQKPGRENQNTDVKLGDKAAAPPIPEIAPLLAAPRPPKLGNAKLVSIAVTDDVPLRDVLIELARLADVDVEIDSGIQGGIDFRAKNKPFNEVVERIANLANLRYSFKEGVLRVQRDTPYVRNYSIDFLNYVRSSQNNVSIATNVLSISGSSGGGGGGGGGGLTSGSSVAITSKAEDDFWTQLDSGIHAILEFQGSNLTSAPSAALGAQSGGGGAASPAGAGSKELPPGEFYVINRQAGVLSVAASEKQQDIIGKFIEQLKTNASAQVLIEAKILEVTLDDEYKTGIDWSKISGDFQFVSKFSPVFDTANVATAVLTNNHKGIDGVVQLAQQFGTTRTLSSPRLHALNNQPAVLTFATNQTYFDVQITTTPTTSVNGVTSTPQTSVTSTQHSIPIGIIMTILPSIDLADNEVTLNVRPTLSAQVGSVNDPGSAYLAAQANAPNLATSVPVVQVRELDSMLKLKSGQIMVIGGLMEQGSNNTDQGVPFLADIPILGNAFKSVAKTSTNSELVIFIRATIVNPTGSYAPADHLVVDKFTKDPRPLAF